MKKILVTLVMLFTLVCFSQTTEMNYVKSTAYQKPFTNENQAVNQDDKIQNITYYDDLGKPKQNIAINAGGNRENLITPIVYDAIGRQPKNYLPLPSIENNGEYFELPLTPLHEFYYNNFQGDRHPYDINPYTENRFEDSPLNRVQETGAPGKDWQIDPNSDSDHTIKYEYQANIDDDFVMMFSVGYQAGDTSKPVLIYDNQYYTSGLLYKNITKDENWTSWNNHTTQEFKNKIGQVVLKRTYNSSSHDTYYIYDDFGNLTFVLSPEASENIIGANNTIDPTVLNSLGYQYKYDERNRLIEKKIPGKGWEHIIYDILDRPVLIQDENLRNDNNKWLFTKFDYSNRVVYTGIYTPPPGETRIQIEDNLRIPGALSEIRKSIPSLIGDTEVYYTCYSYPNLYSDLEVLTINYYDDYIDTAGMNVPNTVFNVSTSNNLKGLATVAKVRILDTNQWITTLTAYDDKSRPIYSRSKNEFLSTNDVLRSKLDFVGKTLETWSTHSKTGNAIIQTRDYFFYDHMGRLKSHKQKIDNEPIQLIAENSYDEIGQLILKKVGGETVQDGYTDITNADVTFDGVITKNGTPNSWDAGVKTTGAITIDGGVKYTILQENKLLCVGLVKANQNRPNWNDGYDYGLYHPNTDSDNDGEKDVKLIINGAIQSTIVSGYNSGDKFSIERSGTQIIFKKNNISFSSITDTEEVSLVGKAGFKNDGAQISEFQIFGSAINKILQNVDYKYNIRGWLTDINNVDNNGLAEKKTDLFNFRINYNKLEGDYNNNNNEIVPLYNGNIAETIWQTENVIKDKRSYGYMYDPLNRIKMAKNRTGENLDVIDIAFTFTLWNVGYDKNGNIQTLKRNGKYTSQAYDNLVYNYEINSNKLLGVEDNSSCACRNEGFNDGNNSNLDYTYDPNGNMLTDANKGITDHITYNHLNLPMRIIIDNETENGTINYVYDATGVKLKKTLTLPTSIINTEYAGNYVYSDNESVGSMQLQFISHPEGYIEPTVVAGTRTEKSIKKFDTGTGNVTYSDYSYVFQFKDHLGNIRLSYSDSDGDGSINSNTEIIEENNFFPFGLKHWGYNNEVAGGNSLAQNWKYNGTELNQDLSLNLYEMDFRQYDPAIGRWIAIDPVTHHNMSPYVAFDNNPVYWADPSGANGEHYNWKNKRYEDDQGNVVSYETALASVKGNTNSNSQENDPKIYVFSSSKESFGRLSLFDVSDDEAQVKSLLGLYPYNELSDEEVRAEAFNLVISILTAGFGSSSRFSRIADLADNSSTASGIGSLQIFPMTEMVNDYEAQNRLFDYERAIAGGPYSVGNWADRNNLIIIFSENSLFNGANYNETSDIHSVDFYGNLIDMYSDNEDFRKVHYMYTGINNGNGIITIINKIKLEK